jgi:hypothetical protein
MCTRPPSKLAAQAYDMCLMSGAMHSFAAEVCIAYSQPAVRMQRGKMLAVGALPYDIVSLDPPNLVIEVMGKQHTNRIMQYAKSNEMRGISSEQIDAAKRKAAHDAGYSTVWLMEGEKMGRTIRWLAMLYEALEHVNAGLPPKHFSSL